MISARSAQGRVKVRVTVYAYDSVMYRNRV